MGCFDNYHVGYITYFSGTNNHDGGFGRHSTPHTKFYFSTISPLIFIAHKFLNLHTNYLTCT